MYPPLAVLPRECTKDWKMPDSNIIVKKGTSVFIPTHGLHYDEKYYPNPKQFNPDRFKTENIAGKTMLDMPYLPFGDGPRVCIGLRMGKMQVKVGLILLLKSYQVELAGNTLKPIQIAPASGLLAPEGGIQLKVSKRI